MKKTDKSTFSIVKLLFFIFINCFLINAQQTYTFTNAGATGRLGPTQLQINSAYSATNLNGLVTSNNGVQTFTIPIGGSYRIEAWGASGGSALYSGKGTKVIHDVTIPAGTVLKIVVGQMGSLYGTGNSDGGGGGSFVGPLTGGLYVAAGGGGGSAQLDNISKDGQLSSSVINGSPSQFGSAAAGYSVNGVNFLYSSFTTVGQSFINGSNGQAGGQASGWPGGTYGEGGFGGGGSACSCNTGSGGGGGGYVGGGGGGAINAFTTPVWSLYVSGFGGSSFGINAPSNYSVTVLPNFGQGKVIITPLCNISLNPSSNPICLGSSVTLTTNAASGILWNTGSTANSIVVTPTATSVYSVTGTSTAACIVANIVTITVQNSSISASSSTNAVCLSNTVALTGIGANTYAWSSGVSNGVPFTPLATVIYTLTGTNACGTFSTTQTVSVSALPVIAISTSSAVCAGNVATLSAGGATTYTWMPGNLVGPSVVVSPLVSTIYTLTGTTPACAGVYTLSLIAKPNPTVTTSASNSLICAGAQVTLTAFGAISYTWQSGPTVSSSLVVSPTTPSVYPVSGTNSLGCTSNSTQVVIVNPSPIINVIASETLICAGGSSTLTASGGSNYTWNFGPTTASVVVSPTANTVYSVISTGVGCSTTQTVSINVFTQTLTVSNSTAICMGSSVTLNASGGTTYLWSNGGTGSSIFVYPSVSTLYTVSAVTVINNMSCNSTGSVNLTINPNPTVTAVLTRSVICRGESTILKANGANTYVWNNTATTPSFAINPIINTNYTVTGTDANGCKGTGTVQVKVNTCTGISEFSNQNGLKIYPNPNNGEFTIESQVNINLELINELGQFVRLIKLSEVNNRKINISELSNGIYFLIGKKDNLKVKQKIIVTK
jgi:hypothetical protein